MYVPKNLIPYPFNAYQLHVLNVYYKNFPYLSINYLQQVFNIFEKKVPMIHIKYWFVNRRNNDWFVKILPKKDQVPPKMIVPKQPLPQNVKMVGYHVNLSIIQQSNQGKRKLTESGSGFAVSKRQKLNENTKMNINFLLN